MFERLGPLFPQAVVAPTVASTSFTNMNANFHVAISVANVARIAIPGAVGQVWEIGPTGTQFSKPATLLAKLGGPFPRMAQNLVTDRYLKAL